MYWRETNCYKLSYFYDLLSSLFSRYEEILDTHKIRYRKPYADKENQKPEAASRDSSSGSAASSNRQPLGKSEPDKVLGKVL